MKEIKEIETKLQQAKENLYACSLKLAEITNKGFKVNSQEFKFAALSVATWANTIFALECELSNAQIKLANKMHDKYFIMLCELSTLAKEINENAIK